MPTRPARSFSPDELALLAGIHADPRADLPRLVYADWLDDHGHESWASLLRSELAAGIDPTAPRDLAPLRTWAAPTGRTFRLVHLSRGLPVVRFVPQRLTYQEVLGRLTVACPRLRLALYTHAWNINARGLWHPLVSRVAMLFVDPPPGRWLAGRGRDPYRLVPRVGIGEIRRVITSGICRHLDLLVVDRPSDEAADLCLRDVRPHTPVRLTGDPAFGGA